MLEFFRNWVKQMPTIIVLYFFFLLVLLMVAPAFAQTSPARKTWRVGEWDLMAHYLENTDTFTHCTMSTTYTAPNASAAKVMKTKALSLIIKLNHDTSFNFMLVGYDWKLVNGKKYNVYSKYNTGKDYNINTVAEDDIGLNVNFPADSDWLQNFMSAKSVEFSIDNTPIGSYFLNGSSKATVALLNCFGEHGKLDVPTFGEGN